MISFALLALPLAVAVPLQRAGPADPASTPRPADQMTAPLSASAGTAPDTVTVGDPFVVRVRVAAPRGALVAFPEFELIEPVEAADSLVVARDSSGTWTATYRLVAWTPSDSLVGVFPFRVRSGEGALRDVRVHVALPHVRSVLPLDSSLHVPRPAKAVVPIAVAGPVGRGWLLPAALLMAVVLLIAWLALRNRRVQGGGSGDPRELALAKLAAIETERLPERGAAIEYYVRVSRVLREYLAAAGDGGESLTTTEILASGSGASARREEAGAGRGLAELLREADRVKFSAAPAASADRFGAEVRRWISARPAAASDLDSRAEAA